ncbi:helix-turn-helix transcriptional regulator [Paraburkholderia flava]|uniref:helix-turn-helix transcriptional regulator n=1 Tax=Paraburkholderia flava TaxID=2547393 RepID=UPI00105D33AA|nr:AlpA family phage regulatory protein [Paraburkholderia flava]
MNLKKSAELAMQLAAAPPQQETQPHTLPNRAARRSKSFGRQTSDNIATPLQQPQFQTRVMTGASVPDRILRLPEVLAMVGIGRTLLLTMVREGEFPAPLRITARIRGWRLSAIQQFLDSLEAHDG